MNELAPRSLLGGSLEGDRILRLVYLDEAGLSNPKHEPFVVVAGVIVNADRDLIALERQIEKIVERHIPEAGRHDFIFHATELFNGGGRVFKRNSNEWPLARRLTIADEIAALPARFKLTVALGWVERSKLHERFPPDFFEVAKSSAVAAHAVAFMSCAMQVEMWMRSATPQEVCMMVVEDNQQAKGLITETQHQYQNKRLVEILDEVERKYFPFRKIKEIPLFARKAQSKPLQLADFCAYVFKRRLMGDARYDRFCDPMISQIAAKKLSLTVKNAQV